MSHEEDSCHENDLPLMANVRDILVYHYILDLRCHVEDKMISGSVVVCCKPTASYETQSDDIHTNSKNTPDCYETSKYLPTNSLLPNASSLMPSPTDSEVVSQFSVKSHDEDNFGSKEVNSVQMSAVTQSLVSDSNKKLLLSPSDRITTDHSDFPTL
ncbi:uncharacterized protein LOC117325222 [Pecten maximus]|uniref:uncharacterized protein LOC117325222 n=1 Tax=Pecten maximus TaxID=6579 RepID=UPI0014587CF7|nr:uncharacterized protein LOC117325222 [Pecten maximus]